MINLGGLTLPDNTFWATKDTYVPIAQTSERSLDGSKYHWEGTIGDRPIDLVYKDAEKAFLTYAQVIELQALASVLNAVYTLIFNSQTLTVRFRHEDKPALELIQLIDNPVPETTGANYYGTIKLIEVG